MKLSIEESVKLRKEIKKIGFNKVKADYENCNINYHLSKNPAYFVQENTDCNEFIMYGEDNSIEEIINSIEQLKNVCSENKIFKKKTAKPKQVAKNVAQLPMDEYLFRPCNLFQSYNP